MDGAHAESPDGDSLVGLGGCTIPDCTCAQYLDGIERIDEDLL